MVLENPRYTGYAFFGRWTKQETLLDPEGVSAGNVVRFRRAEPVRVVRSRRPAHPEIISVKDFTRAQLMRRSKGASGLRTARTTERTRTTIKPPFLFRGRIRHAGCGRKMAGSPRAHGIHYRYPARTLALGSLALADHPPTVYLREAIPAEAAGWIGGLFARENVDRTVAALIASQPATGGLADDRATAKHRLADAETRLRRPQAAARAELDNVPELTTATDAKVYAPIDSLGDVGTALAGPKPEKAASPYDLLRPRSHCG
ncbi:recombinase family protein [Amycolatopsis sp. GM8]|uniref:recombinase family protein n=1 Tax=Amycolatopsis sp. GM8 TaxID=2896530 RepID=UPI001F19126B|nr:recombinase family protein [Amycolatopsis sp. GM8]